MYTKAHHTLFTRFYFALSTQWQFCINKIIPSIVAADATANNKRKRFYTYMYIPAQHAVTFFFCFLSSQQSRAFRLNTCALVVEQGPSSAGERCAIIELYAQKCANVMHAPSVRRASFRFSSARLSRNRLIQLMSSAAEKRTRLYCWCW